MVTHKDRYLKAVNLEIPDMVPVDGALDLIHAQKILDKAPMNTSIFLTEKKDALDMNDVAKHNQQLLNEASMKFDFDCLIVNDWNVYPDGFRPKFLDETRYIDHLGRIHKVKPDVKTTYWVDGIVKSPDDLEKFELPDPEDLNMDLVEETLKVAAGEYPVMGWCHSVVHAPYQIRGGLDKLAFDVYRQPEFAKKLIEKAFNYEIGMIRRLIELGVDIIVEGDDLADIKGPMFSPKIFREFFFPYIKKFIDECHKHNIPVMKHSDGNLTPILEELINLGYDGIHPIEPAVMDIGKVKQQYGNRIFLRGNVDCVHILPYGSEEDVRRDVRRCIDAAAKGGGFILSDSNSLHSNVKTENIKIMVDETRKYGRYN